MVYYQYAYTTNRSNKVQGIFIEMGQMKSCRPVEWNLRPAYGEASVDDAQQHPPLLHSKLILFSWWAQRCTSGMRHVKWCHSLKPIKHPGFLPAMSMVPGHMWPIARSNIPFFCLAVVSRWCAMSRANRATWGLSRTQRVQPGGSMKLLLGSVADMHGLTSPLAATPAKSLAVRTRTLLVHW
jgi:hypothetical protein